MAEKKYIRVDGMVIQSNRINGTNEPPLRIRCEEMTAASLDDYIKCTEIQIGPNTRIVYSPDNPLSCGGSVWIETTERVDII